MVTHQKHLRLLMSTHNICLRTHPQHMFEALLISTQNMFLWRNKKNIYLNTPLDAVVLSMQQMYICTVGIEQLIHFSPMSFSIDGYCQSSSDRRLAICLNFFILTSWASKTDKSQFSQTNQACDLSY